MAPAQKKQRLSNGTVAAVDVVDDQQNDAKPDETTAKPQQNRSLFVRSLPASTTTESLTALFSDSYPIKHATAVIDRETKQCKGFGFVTFADPEDAQRAKTEFNGHVIEGKKLRIELAEARQRDKGEKGAAGAEKGDVESSPKKLKGRLDKEPSQPQSSRLIVRNLPWTIKNSADLSKHFMSFGKVKQAYIPKKHGGLMAGFGFVVMRGRKNAEKALEGVNGKEVDGRTLAVDWAVEKEAYETAMKGEEPGEEEEEEEATDEENVDDEEGADEHLEGMSDYDDNEDDEDDSEDDEDDEDVEMDDEEGEDAAAHDNQAEDKSSTLFVRNLPFTCQDEDLEDHFTRFGSVRYARVVMDYATGRSKGTGFVCFYETTSADACLRTAPQRSMLAAAEKSKDKSAAPTNSILQNDMADPSGEHTLDGRVLQITRAVEKKEANRLSDEGLAHRNKRDKDKRRLYLLGEGTIPSNTKLWESLAPSERTMREASAKQRKSLIEGNPSLHMSLTRLSVRNIPRTVGSKELKALAREAVVGFATEVKAEKRSRLSKEELARGGEEMQEAEKARKKSGKGLVRQAKVVFEGAGGSKVSEETGAGRSRGYGFIEYYTHRSALMGLRWLNGHSIGYQVKESGKGMSREDAQDRKKRLIVEFAIENAQVVLRRNDREVKARERSKAVSEGRAKAITEKKDRPGKFGKGSKGGKDGKPGMRKRKRDSEAAVQSSKPGDDSTQSGGKLDEDEKLKKRNQIIGRKRAMRRAKKGGK